MNNTKCFKCNSEINKEKDTYAVLEGTVGNINFCEDCGKQFNIPLWYNEIPNKYKFLKDAQKAKQIIEDIKKRNNDKSFHEDQEAKILIDQDKEFRDITLKILNILTKNSKSQF